MREGERLLGKRGDSSAVQHATKRRMGKGVDKDSGADEDNGGSRGKMGIRQFSCSVNTLMEGTGAGNLVASCCLHEE